MTNRTDLNLPGSSRPPTSSNGRTTAGATVAPPNRRLRMPELAVGVFVTAAFALGAVLWHLNTVSKVPALALATSVARGDTIDAEDLRVMYVASDDPLARLDDSQSDRVVGRVALIDLAVGTLLTPALVADAAALHSGDGVVGLALDPGQYPALALAPGDRVNVVRSAEADTAAVADDELVVVRGATVFAVDELASDRKLVSILAGEADADAVAAASNGSLRLVLVAP